MVEEPAQLVLPLAEICVIFVICGLFSLFAGPYSRPFVVRFVFSVPLWCNIYSA
jgi:hypothetical protein